MNIKGTIRTVFSVQNGTSKKSGQPWQKQEFIVDYGTGEAPHAILLNTMDGNIIGKLRAGLQVEVNFDFNVNEWTNPQGVKKYFNEPRIWQNGLHCIGQTQAQQQPAAPQPQAQAPASQQPASGSSDYLPF